MKKIMHLLLISMMMLTVIGCGSSSNKEDKMIDGMILNGELAALEKDRLMSLRVKVNRCKKYDVVANINADSFIRNEDGSVSFTASGPKDETLHFYGEGIDYVNNELVLYPSSFVYGLESMGVIYSYTPTVTSYANDDETIDFWGGYTFSDATEVESYQDIVYTIRHGVQGWCADGESSFDTFKYFPNFVAFGGSKMNVEPITVSSFIVHYDTERYTTDIMKLYLDRDFYPTVYLEDERYEPAFEQWKEEDYILDFYLRIVPDIFPEEYQQATLDDSILLELISVYGVEDRLFTVGDLRDENGNIVDKNSPLKKGYTIDVTIGDETSAVELPISERYAGAETLSELIPHQNPNAYGDLNVLVVPLSWQDYAANDEDLMTMKKAVGRVHEDGQIVDYTSESESLSSYFDQSSYSHLKLTSYFTDWFEMPYTFQQMKEYNFDQVYMEEIGMIDWLKEQNLDMSLFDKDQNLIYDAVVFLNSAVDTEDDYYHMASFEGAVQIDYSYGDYHRGTEEALGINSFINVNTNVSDAANVLIHEFGHILGLIDYYDVTYSGIDAVGHYDMQSGNAGDWNAYSKYAVGWIDPVVVTGLSSGESIDIEIGAFQTTGDAIVVPASESDFDGPFDEYMLIDLFSDTGLAAYQTDYNLYDIKGALGVHMYHVNAKMEKNDLSELSTEEGVIGTVHQTNAYNIKGKYMIELIQSSGVNTFTHLEGQLYPYVGRDDFFYEGDVFLAEEYTEFLVDGKMDNGVSFGYEIEIVSIDQQNETAVVRITKQ